MSQNLLLPCLKCKSRNETLNLIYIKLLLLLNPSINDFIGQLS